MLEILYSALCVAAISFTITVTSIFTWFREIASKIHPKIEELVFCPWCFGHYVTFVMLLTMDISLIQVSKFAICNFLFTSFVIICISGVIHHILLRAYEPVVKATAIRQLRQSQKQNQK